MSQYIILSGGIPRLLASDSIYDTELSVVSTITAGTPVTLPAAGTYTADELEVYQNGVRLDINDYSYVGSPPRTQVQFAFDLVALDVVRFRVDRAP